MVSALLFTSCTTPYVVLPVVSELMKTSALRSACCCQEVTALPAAPIQVQMVKPGDASMAAPFTAKAMGVMPCTDIIRQGRSALVTTVQMFKILGLTCLSTAFSLSVMYLQVRGLLLPLFVLPYMQIFPFHIRPVLPLINS